MASQGRTRSNQRVILSQIFKQISRLWENSQVDLFATSLSKKLPLFVSPIPDPQAWAVDALNIPWENLVVYAFPPNALLPKVVQKLQSHTCRIIRIAPGWPTKLGLGPSGDVSGHSKKTTPHMHSAQTTTEQPLPGQPNIPKLPCLVSRSSTLQQHATSSGIYLMT